MSDHATTDEPGVRASVDRRYGNEMPILLAVWGDDHISGYPTIRFLEIGEARRLRDQLARAIVQVEGWGR